jgi:hypothetical protein
LIVQVPAPVIVTVEPELVQMPALPAAIVNVTGRPELAVAVAVYVGPPTVAPAGAVEVKLIDWVLADAAETVNACCTCVAAW